jgi:uncharacterized membrane protein YccC
MSTASDEPASSEPAAVSAAVRGAAHFDRDLVSVRGGLLAAIPVAGTLGGGLAVGDPVAGVTMAAGAMLVGIAWRNAGGRPPLAVMAIDAVVMSLATFLGSVTGALSWLHFVVLVLVAMFGGLLVSIGNRGGAVGVQAIIAVIVFGRFSEPAAQALGLAALVLAGGLAQVGFVALVRWPTPLRTQRTATATGYRALSRLADSRSPPTSIPAATALDEAAATLSSPHLFGDAAVMTLRSLVTEGHWIRVQVYVIRMLLHRQRTASEDPADARFGAVGERALALAADALNLIADAIDGDRASEQPLAILVAEFSSNADALAAKVADHEPAPGSVAADELQLSRRISALAGQLRAVSTQAPAAGRGGGLRSRRPHPAANRPLQRVRDQASQLRANMSLQSPAGRHALRLAAVVAFAELLARHLPLDRSYWMVVAAAAVLRPDFSGTFTRGAERALGTSVGVGIAGAIAVAAHPGDAATVLIVGLLAWAAYATYPASFASGFGFITAVVVFLINTITPDTLEIASARLLDTLVGSAIGLLAYVLWPTWSQMPARQALATFIDAQRAYLSAILNTVVNGQTPDQQQLIPLARRARVTWTSAQATVARSLSEPARRRIDQGRSQAALGSLRRLSQSTHALRLDARDDPEHKPFPELAELAGDLDLALVRIGATAESDTGSGPPPIPDLRADYIKLERDSRSHDEVDRIALLSELDEIVDAVDSLARLGGWEVVDAPAPSAQGVRPTADVLPGASDAV